MIKMYVCSKVFGSYRVRASSRVVRDLLGVIHYSVRMRETSDVEDARQLGRESVKTSSALSHTRSMFQRDERRNCSCFDPEVFL